MTIKVGVIGLGKMGLNHLRKIKIIQKVQIVFLFDTRMDVIDDVSEEFKSKFFSKVEEILSYEVDAVVIASPTSTHEYYFSLFLGRVKNIFVEKPVASNYYESSKIYGNLKNKKVNLHVGYIERYNKAFISLLNKVKGKEIISVDFYREGFRPDKLKDNIVMDLVIHDLDLANIMLGVTSSSKPFVYKKNNCICDILVFLNNNSNARCTIHSSYVSHQTKRLIVVKCSDLVLECDLVSKSITSFKEGEFFKVEYFESHSDQLEDELSHFFKRCKNKYDGNVNYKEDFQLMKICDEINNKINNLI